MAIETTRVAVGASAIYAELGPTILSLSLSLSLSDDLAMGDRGERYTKARNLTRGGVAEATRA